MAPIDIVFALFASGIAPAILNWLEGRRIFQRRDRRARSLEATGVAGDVEQLVGAGVVAQAAENVSAVALSGATNEDLVKRMVLDVLRSAEFADAMRGEIERLSDGEPRTLNRHRRAQVLVTVAIAAFIVYALATKTNTEVAFAFMGSVGGFWLREVAA